MFHVIKPTYLSQNIWILGHLFPYSLKHGKISHDAILNSSLSLHFFAPYTSFPILYILFSRGPKTFDLFCSINSRGQTEEIVFAAHFKIQMEINNNALNRLNSFLMSGILKNKKYPFSFLDRIVRLFL